MGAVTLQGLGRFAATAVGAQSAGRRIVFRLGEGAEKVALIQRLEQVGQAERLVLGMVEAARQSIVATFEEGLAKGAVSMIQLFDTSYVPIPGTDPRQFTTTALTYLERVLPAVQDPVLAQDNAVAFCACVDHNGYLPVHNRDYSKPQSADLVWNNAHCRNRRIFNDRTGLAAARSIKPHLVQVYVREMGGASIVMMKDLSMPIMVAGRHWGAVRMGYRQG